ncbi:hypothetical protein CYLTODRAFT_259059 [Cylindrobasidium torrendii FP15055 ss-10]|uniref:MYND-type domain-containing protein n=1 Tax=Cylindrobasidium torrendii FP15055 ss-10 TaxID=1314674 RepID=A0A0D7BG20_9AGAR|nr:hypothetical protein CYLTODRAFT_259059 [Cylindrobasidium torrendii FP15055 ss-10]
MVVHCSTECQRWHWADGRHRLHCNRLRQSQSLQSLYTPVDFIDLVAISEIVLTGLKATNLSHLLRSHGKDVLAMDLSTGDSARMDNLRKFLSSDGFGSSDEGHWQELRKQRAPQSVRSLYVLIMIGRWPLDLTNMD